MITKQPAIVSKVLRASAFGEACTLRLVGCVGDYGVVLAHIRTKGVGGGRKPDDIASCYACANCHDLIDGRKPWPGRLAPRRGDAILEAMIRTHRRMFDKGLLEVKR